MRTPAIHPAVQRDRSLQRLRDLTFASAAGAAGLLGLFSIVAAATVPGPDRWRRHPVNRPDAIQQHLDRHELRGR